MTAISYHDTVKDLQGLAFTARGPFARPEWFELLEEAGNNASVALAQSGGDALALPLTRDDQGLRAGLKGLSNWYAFTWRELATSPATQDKLLNALARDLQSRTSRIVLEALPDEDGTATRLEAGFRKAGWNVRREICDTNHVLEVSGQSYADYLAARPGKLRTTLKRKAKKVSVEILTQFKGDIWDCYEEVYGQSWKPEEGDPAMLRQFAQAEGAAGRVRLGTARHDGTVIAAQFWTVENGTAYIHKLTHLESAKQLSAGTTLTAALFEHVIDRDKVNLVDFGTGDDPYKRDWMEQIRPRFRLTCLKPSDPLNWPEMGKAALRKLVSRDNAG